MNPGLPSFEALALFIIDWVNSQDNLGWYHRLAMVVKGVTENGQGKRINKGKFLTLSLKILDQHKARIIPSCFVPANV